MNSTKGLLLLGFIGLMVFGVLSSPSKFARNTEREGSDSNDVNYNRRDHPVSPSGEDTSVAVDEDDDEESPEDGMFLSFKPFRHHSIVDMFTEFRRMEAVMREIQNRILNLTVNLPETYDNSTSDIVVIGGRRYKIERSIIKRGDNDSSFFISATSLVPADRRKKREALALSSFAEELHRKKRESKGDEDDETDEEDDG